MISIPAAFLICTVAVLSIGVFVWREASVRREFSRPSDHSLLDDDAAELLYCPPEFVARVFSPDDCKFVSRARSRQLNQLFRRERKVVALVWVYQTKLAINRVMREHTRVTRQSQDLHFATEAQLVLSYMQLILVCNLLCLAIQSAGPARLGTLATYVDSLSQRIAQARDGLAVATSSAELRGVNPLS